MYTFDHNLMLALNFDGGWFWDGFFQFASGKLSWAPLYLLILWLIWRRAGWPRMLLAAAFIVTAVVAADMVASFFKHYTPRLRPTHTPGLQELLHTVDGYKGGLYGTVSAHAATVFAIAVFTLAVIRRHAYTVFILLWALLVSYSRIYLGVHFPMDLLWGMIVGIVVAVLSLWGYRKTAEKLKI